MMRRSSVAASTASISAPLASRFLRSTQPMTSTGCAFQTGSMPRPGGGLMAPAAFVVGASVMRRWISRRPPNSVAWYRLSEDRKVHGPTTIGRARGCKLLNAHHAARENPKAQTWALG